MAYGQGNIITANDNPDFNTLATLVNEVVSDTNSGATAEASANFGYGVSPAISLVSPGDIVTAAQWTALFSAISRAATHQGTSPGIVPASVSAGQLVVAYDGATGLVQVVNNIRSNRLNVAAGQSAVTAGGTRLTSTRNTSWDNLLIHEFNVDFGSYDAARYFFNTGGQIRLSASRSGGSVSLQNDAWTSLLSNIGLVTFDHTQTTNTGSTGAGSSIGFYNLTSTYQTIFNATPGGGYYFADQYRVEARSNGAFGSSGIVQFRISFDTVPGADVVDGTINSFVDDRRSVGAIDIAAPSYTTTTPLSSGS